MRMAAICEEIPWWITSIRRETKGERKSHLIRKRWDIINFIRTGNECKIILDENSIMNEVMNAFNEMNNHRIKSWRVIFISRSRCDDNDNSDWEKLCWTLRRFTSRSGDEISLNLQIPLLSLTDSAFSLHSLLTY
jgi:hypothetical protein